MAFFRHLARSAAGSAAEAIYDAVLAGDNGNFFTVAQGRVTRIRLAELLSLHAAGFGITRIRQDATAPTAGTPPILAAADQIEVMFVVPIGAGGVQDLGPQPAELPGGALAAGTNYYFTIEQPGGAARAETLVNGSTT